MAGARILGLRLTAFKSFRDVTLPLAPLTVLVGRNGGGKSNSLDALDVLQRLATVGDVRDALEGSGGDAGAVRGGIEGCAPFGADAFELGVRTARPAGGVVDLDVRIQVRPQVQIVRERLAVTENGRSHVLLETTEADPDRADIGAGIWNNRRGRNPHYTFRASHLLTAQLPLRLAGETAAEKRVLEVADEVLSVLGGLFHLDPVPHLMRRYVPERDVILRRNGDNLSGAVAYLRDRDPDAFATLVDVIEQLPEHEVRGLEIRHGGFGEVMLGLSEVEDGEVVTVPARQMSDGMLRMIAILTALLGRGRALASSRKASSGDAPVMLVLEELENGLHPTQAARILDVVARSAAEQDFQVVVTTHSPALLNALPGDDHPGVVVIGRERATGASRATPLVELPGYHAMMATGGLGDVMSAGRLPPPGAPPEVDTTELDRLLGIA